MLVRIARSVEIFADELGVVESNGKSECLRESVVSFIDIVCCLEEREVVWWGE